LAQFLFCSFDLRIWISILGVDELSEFFFDTEFFFDELRVFFGLDSFSLLVLGETILLVWFA